MDYNLAVLEIYEDLQYYEDFNENSMDNEVEMIDKTRTITELYNNRKIGKILREYAKVILE